MPAAVFPKGDCCAVDPKSPVLGPVTNINRLIERKREILYLI